jgi:trehalose utilization protein
VSETFPFKPKFFRKRVRKVIMNGVKWKEYKCGENRSEMKWNEV